MSEAQPIPGDLLNRIARFGRVYLLDTVTSTNDYAFSIAGKQEPAIVIARKQTRGRGRFRRHWFASEESLIASILLFSRPGVTSTTAVTQIAGLALCRAIEQLIAPLTRTPMHQHYLPRPLLRWPNDVLINDKKVAGILCEQKGRALVVGIGVNVNQTSLPANLPEAGSLRLSYQEEFNPLLLLEATLTEFFAALQRLGKDPRGVWDDIRAHSAIIHRRVEIRTLLRRHIGTVLDIDDEGRVVLRTDSGRLVALSAGQVRQLR